ncbi:MAG: ATP-grasp domain-containing protein [PVC group bacterium]
MPDERVLVAGTTADYIDLIRRRFPGRAVFLTDPAERAKPSPYPAPDRASEILCGLSSPREALAALDGHLRRQKQRLTGVACFDCESLSLAAEIARSFSLPFPSLEAVDASRNKFFSKRLWLEAGLPCPEVRLARTADAAADFLRGMTRAAVMKPLTGSGSELIFLCRDEKDCRRAFATLSEKLSSHPNSRMYEPRTWRGEEIDPRKAFVIEEMVEGEELSCDFALDHGAVKIIRIARKILARNQTFGTVLAYILTNALPSGIDPAGFRRQMAEAARALGISRSICMIDFMVSRGRALMLEMTPRPGGDCLVSLERLSAGFDMLGYALDFAEGRQEDPPPAGSWQPLVGIHLLADRPGTIRAIDDRKLRGDPRVLEYSLTAGPGRRVLMPPDDYDSRKLGHAVFRPRDPAGIEKECLELSARLIVEFEPE